MCAGVTTWVPLRHREVGPGSRVGVVGHDPSPYLRALRRDGTLCMLGLPERFAPEAMALLGRRTLTVSGSGGRPRTQEMLEFCAERGITADVEVLPLAQVGTAMRRLGHDDVRHRFVLDIAGP